MFFEPIERVITCDNISLELTKAVVGNVLSQTELSNATSNADWNVLQIPGGKPRDKSHPTPHTAGQASGAWNDNPTINVIEIWMLN